MSTGPQLFRIDDSSRKSEEIMEVEFSQLGFRERRDIQEWITANPGILGEGLLIIAKEFSGFDRTNASSPRIRSCATASSTVASGPDRGEAVRRARNSSSTPSSICNSPVGSLPAASRPDCTHRETVEGRTPALSAACAAFMTITCPLALRTRTPSRDCVHRFSAFCSQTPPAPRPLALRTRTPSRDCVHCISADALRYQRPGRRGFGPRFLPNLLAGVVGNVGSGQPSTSGTRWRFDSCQPTGSDVLRARSPVDVNVLSSTRPTGTGS